MTQETSNSHEKLMQVIASLKWENEKLQSDAQQAQQLLNGLEKLLSIDVNEDPFTSVLLSLSSTFTFSQAMVLIETSDTELSCVMGEPYALADSIWPIGPFFNKVMSGHVSSIFSHAEIEEWKGVKNLPLSVDQPALYMPLKDHNRRGILVLLRSADKDAFNHHDIALGKKYSLLASHALAAHTSNQIISETKARAIAAEETIETKTMFLANMSHELRTPLNAIIGFSDLIEKETMGPVGVPIYNEYIRDINSSGQHLLSIVNNLLLYSQIEAGQQKVNIEPISLLDELKAILRILSIDAQKYGVSIEFKNAQDEILVDADQLSLRQVFINLIGNALKFSPTNSKVIIAFETDAIITRIKISDDGCGIPPETLKLLGHQPFTQAEETYSRAYQGTGLGVAICFRLIESMKSKIFIDSVINQGTTVTVELNNSENNSATNYAECLRANV